MAKFKYIGYGFIATNRNIEDVAISSTSAYKLLKAAFLNDIIYESGEVNSNRPKLRQLFENIINTQSFNTVIVVPNIETLGGTIAEALNRYSMIIDIIHLIILNRPDLSTITLDGEVLVSNSDIEKKDLMKAAFRCSNITQKGRKAMSPDAKFRKVFWAWQNYYIDTKDAIKLLGCARARLYSLAKEFMTSSAFSDLYFKEFEMNMTNYEEKAVRGIMLDDALTEFLLEIREEIGIDWTTEKVSDVIFKMQPQKIQYITKDYIRLKLNYMYGKAAMASATKKFSKGPEYVEQLKKELLEM